MPYRNYQDETLVMLTLAGETDAYGELVVRYQHAVVSAAMSVTHVHFIAEDAAQDAFVTAWMKLDSLHEQGRFCAWVCRIARNCARNMIMRYRGFLSLDEIGDFAATENDNPQDIYEKQEEREELRRSIGRLPERVREIIRLHYFEGMSIVEIADRLRITEGTVKSQLHDGRKRIRKELCAMNEKWNDTLLQKVMKKVAELKMWRLKNNKDGFEKIYKDVLRDVEELPESNQKQHALADVLMHGWWWLGDENDALFARIKQAAETGHNDEVMEFIVTREDSQVSDDARIDFIREKQIPYLRKHGFTHSLAREWFWLGFECCRADRAEEGRCAYDEAKKLLTPRDAYYALVMNSSWMEETLIRFADVPEQRYLIGCCAEKLRRVDGCLRYWTHEMCGEGCLVSINRSLTHLLHAVSHCDGHFLQDDFAVGDSKIGSDGTALTFVAAHETVTVPAGTFTDCQVWRTDYWGPYGMQHYLVSCAEGVGIVKCDAVSGDITDTLQLTSYEVHGGDGYLPMAQGNMWRYAMSDDPSYLATEFIYEVTYADEEEVVFASRAVAERIAYDPTSWKDAIQEIRCEYWRDNGNSHSLHDVTSAIIRAEQLASTPVERAHTAHAASTMRRILATDDALNPNRTMEGCWNFFVKQHLHREQGRIRMAHDSRWSFEWKKWHEGCDPVCCNMIFSILQDAGQYLWNTEWQIGADAIIEYTLYEKPLKIQINCTDGGTITTKAGRFDNCMCITFDVTGMKRGHRYRGGRKVYWFAPEVGIVKTLNALFDGAQEAVYELVRYEGTGEGYMPVCDGLVREYEAVGLTDGFRAGAVYTYLEDSYGDVVLFCEKIGVKELPSISITRYSEIYGEKREEQLWLPKRRDDSRLRHDINNLNILLHYLCRYNRAWGVAERGVADYLHKLALMETFAIDGVIPQAWWGCYAATLLRAGCWLFGAGRNEQGYTYLERALEGFLKWKEISDGTDLEFGDKYLFGGVKYRKGAGYIILPNGSKELLYYSQNLDMDISVMHHAMTTKNGWEWFKPVREEERYKLLVERVANAMK